MSEKHHLQDHEIKILVDFAKKVVINSDDFWDIDFEILNEEIND